MSRYPVKVSCPICNGICYDATVDKLTVCLTCKHIFQPDLAVTVAYDADYAHQYDNRPVKAMSDLRWDFIQSVLRLPMGSRILDVGYGNGAFLKRARDAGMEIYGIDLHSEDFGIPVVNFGTKLTFDLICFFDSLEHFPDFNDILKLSAHSVIVSIPDAPDFLLQTPRSWRHFKPGEHLHYFSRASLDTFMRDWGFDEKLADGHPEDLIRGRLSINGTEYNNIYTAIYGSTSSDHPQRS